MSLQSPLSPVSAISELHFAIDDMPVPQRPIERMSSYPSLSHSSTTATSDDVHDQLNAALLTPTDAVYSVETGTRDDIEILSPVIERKGGFRGLTKSMQSLRGRAKADKERSRSTSRERPPMPVLEPAIRISPPPQAQTQSQALPQATKPVAIPRSTSSNAVPTRPKPQRSGSSFSSFIRKLTGGGKSSKPSPPTPTVTPQSMPARAVTTAPREPVRKPTLAINTFASPPSRPPVLRKTSLPLEIMASKPSESPKIETGPTTSDAYMTLSVDPRTVPLPPSPPSPALVLPENDVHDFSLSPSSDDKIITPGLSSLTCSPSLKQVKQIGKLRLDGSDAPSARTDDAINEGIEEEEEEEEDDVVQPLRSMTSQSSRRVVESPVTASTFNDEVQTPTSPSFSDNVVIRQSSSSPPRFGSSPNQPEVAPRKPEGLGRKESKWRKSVMNLSETLNGSSKKVSKPPPTSYDNYLAHQQRVATHRRSCAPTLHSTASVSAEIRQIKDKEQQDVADTFFLS